MQKSRVFYGNVKDLIKNRTKMSLIVIRINKLGELKNSKPCQDCLKYIRRYPQVQKIYYSDDNGSIMMEKVKDIDNNHQSRTTLKLISNGIL